MIGKNATGKTTVLDGIAVAIGGFLSGIDELPGKELHKFSKNDVRYLIDAENGLELSYHIGKDRPMRVESVFQINDYEMTWARFQNKVLGRTRTAECKNISFLSEELVRQSRDEALDKTLTLPIFAFHGTGRLYKYSSITDDLNMVTRFFAYKDCLNSNSNHKYFVSWFLKKSKENYEMEKIGKKVQELEYIKTCIIDFMSSLTERKVMNVLDLNDDVWLYFEDGELLSLQSMGDGYKRIFDLVTDIAYRIVVLNKNQNYRLVPGVVLIDEIDLHIHPSWQKKVVGVLLDIFPNIQFIATSHSPFIIQSISEGSFINLDAENEIENVYIGNQTT